MLTWPLVLAALAAGLMGGVHCVGMCGGLSQWLLPAPRRRHVIPIMLAVNVGDAGADRKCLTNKVAATNATGGKNNAGGVGGINGAGGINQAGGITGADGTTVAALIALHGGRLTTYALIGALAGVSGGAALTLRQVPHWPLFLMGNLALLYLGCQLAGLRWNWHLPPAWQALVAKLLQLLPRPANYPPYVNGLAWGCMPCGLLYSVLPFALLSGAAWSGALLMLLFGLASLPHLLWLPLAGRARGRWSCLRPLAGGLMVVWALFGLLQMAGVIPALTTDWCIVG